MRSTRRAATGRRRPGSTTAPRGTRASPPRSAPASRRAAGPSSGADRPRSGEAIRTPISASGPIGASARKTPPRRGLGIGGREAGAVCSVHAARPVDPPGGGRAVGRGELRVDRAGAAAALDGAVARFSAGGGSDGSGEGDRGGPVRGDRGGVLPDGFVVAVRPGGPAGADLREVQAAVGEAAEDDGERGAGALGADRGGRTGWRRRRSRTSSTSGSTRSTSGASTRRATTIRWRA